MGVKNAVSFMERGLGGFVVDGWGCLMEWWVPQCKTHPNKTSHLSQLGSD